jgi:hypothetical protein
MKPQSLQPVCERITVASTSNLACLQSRAKYASCARGIAQARYRSTPARWLTRATMNLSDSRQ